MSRDEFFDNLFNEATPAAEDLKAIRQLAYEERVIKRVFTECGAKPQYGWGAMAKACRAATDEVKLNFRWFNSAYGTFPGKLIGGRIPYLHKLTIVDLFKPVEKNRLVKAVSKQLVKHDIDPGVTGYVFVFPIIKTAFCAHSLLGAGQDFVGDGSRVQLWFRLHGVKRPMFIEPLKTLCQTIGDNWSSD
jgi:hypothetical protein